MSYQKGSIEDKGNGTFLLRYRMRDTKHPSGWRKGSELLKAKTEKAAQKEQVERMRQVNEQNVKIDSQPIGSSGSFQDFKDGLWQDHLRMKKRKASTLYGYESLLRNHIILRVLGPMKIGDITPAVVTKLLNEISRERVNGQGPKLLNVYSLLRHMFEVATEYDMIELNPVRKKLHRPDYKAKKKPVLTPEQVGAILGEIPGKWYAFALAMVLMTVRIGELLALQWRDIDWTKAKATITKNVWKGEIQNSPKEGDDIYRHLPEPLLQALILHRRQAKFAGAEDYVFCDANGGLSDPDLLRRDVLYSAMDRAGIRRGHRTHGFHIFRHTGGSIVRRMTGDMKLAQLQLAHANMATTSDIYVHTDMEDVKRAAEVLAGTYEKFLPTNLPTN